MSQQPLTTQQEDAAAAVRAILLDGACEVETFAIASNRCVRTVYAWIAKGLPVVRIGKTPYVLVAPGAEWVRNPPIRGQQPRRPGRPTGPTQKRKP